MSKCRTAAALPLLASAALRTAIFSSDSSRRINASTQAATLLNTVFVGLASFLLCASTRIASRFAALSSASNRRIRASTRDATVFAISRRLRECAAAWLPRDAPEGASAQRGCARAAASNSPHRLLHSAPERPGTCVAIRLQLEGFPLSRRGASRTSRRSAPSGPPHGIGRRPTPSGEAMPTLGDEAGSPHVISGSAPDGGGSIDRRLERHSSSTGTLPIACQ